MQERSLCHVVHVDYLVRMYLEKTASRLRVKKSAEIFGLAVYGIVQINGIFRETMQVTPSRNDS